MLLSPLMWPQLWPSHSALTLLILLAWQPSPCLLSPTPRTDRQLCSAADHPRASPPHRLSSSKSE